jgi:hypothetical protein
MSNVKTAISIDAALFKQAEAAAHEMKVSRSRLFALAIEEFLRRRETQQLVASLNEVYGGEPDPEDELALQGMRRLYRKVLEGEGNEW